MGERAVTSIPEPWAELAAEVGADKREWGSFGPDVNGLIRIALEELRRRREALLRISGLPSDVRDAGKIAFEALYGSRS
jgi:hypothetical protein